MVVSKTTTKLLLAKSGTIQVTAQVESGLSTIQFPTTLTPNQKTNSSTDQAALKTSMPGELTASAMADHKYPELFMIHS